MNPLIGWALAACAVVGGALAWGWQGAVLGVTVVVFWLLLQFSRTLRLLRAAGQRPVGEIDSAVMLHTRVHPGMRLVDVLPLTRSLGRRVNPAQEEPQVWVWTDPAGHEMRVALRRGRVSEVTLHRAGEP